MKKLLFILTFLCAMLLCMSVAFAEAHPCDACGSADTTLAGSGAWCHWDCNECGYRTSRNHNPNSYNSGLVPDSCSGTCVWCGAAATFSSHTFTTWIPTGDATCLQDGTDTSPCDNVQCSASITRPAPGSALGHEFKPWVSPPTCEEGGYTFHSCIRCDECYIDSETEPLGHAYDVWTHHEDNTHSSSCTRAKCNSSITAPCSTITTVAGGKKLTMCPVCSYIVSEDVIVNLGASSNATAESLDGSKLPGKLTVLVDAAPLEVELKTDAFYMFIAYFQANGKTVEPTSPVKITIDLNEHPFSIPDSIFFDVPPAELKARAFKIVRVEQELMNGEPVEVWHEMPFTLEEGVLSFETDKMGTFLMVLNIMQAPSVG